VECWPKFRASCCCVFLFHLGQLLPTGPEMMGMTEAADAAASSGGTINVIWILRVILPILLFIMWYRSQPQKSWGDGKYVYPKALLLEARQLLIEGKGPSTDSGEADSPPDSLRGLKLIGEAAALQLLGISVTRAGGSGGRRDARASRGGAKKKSGDLGDASATAAGTAAEAEAEVQAETSAGSQGGGGSGGGGGGGSGGAANLTNDLALAGPTKESSSANVSGANMAPIAQQLLSKEERMNHESLLNFVTFSHKERQQRTFLHGPDQIPPPPAPTTLRRPPPTDTRDTEAMTGEPPVPPETLRANTEAQMVLRGLVNPKIGMRSSRVPRGLYYQLTEAGLQVLQPTFSLMVEACVGARDLRGASDLLMKMEAAGHCADSELLDRVMDLYSAEGSRGAATGAVTEAAGVEREETSAVVEGTDAPPDFDYVSGWPEDNMGQGGGYEGYDGSEQDGEWLARRQHGARWWL